MIGAWTDICGAQSCQFIDARMIFRRILIAVDGTPIATRAAEMGAELARSVGADVALLYVADTSGAYGVDAGVSPNELAARAQDDGRRLLSGYRQRLSLSPATLEFFQSGVPAREISNTARDWPADLIVIGSHGRAGIKRALLGSVAETVMRQAPCPVLVVRAPG